MEFFFLNVLITPGSQEEQDEIPRIRAIQVASGVRQYRTLAYLFHVDSLTWTGVLGLKNTRRLGKEETARAFQLS